MLILSENRYFTYTILERSGSFILLREYKQSEDEDFTDFHESVLKLDPFLNRAFSKVSVGISNKRLVLVPEVIFNEQQSVHYLENSSPIWTSDKVMVDIIRDQDIRMVYAFRNSVLIQYRQHFSNLEVNNALTKYIGALNSLLSGLKYGHNLFINALYDTMYVVLFRNNELTFANVYEFSTAEDFLYYVMLIFKEFQLDQDSTPTYISGKLDKDSIIHDLLLRYIRNLNFISTEGSDQLRIDGIPPQLYFDLFALRS